ncbi:MAG TPA: SRPBCC domain-containing protein [Thermoanaerobaculia bacterium]
MSEAIRQGDIPGVQLRRRQDLALSAEEAWRWLAEPGKLALWLAREAEVDEGGFLLRGEDGGRERGRTIEIAPPKLWVLSFERLDAGWPAATRLTLRIHRTPEGSQIDVLQDGFQRLPLSIGLTVWEGYRVRWRTALARLAEVTVGKN